jgi:hypothetical protein
MGLGITEVYALEDRLRVVKPVFAYQHLVADCWRTGHYTWFRINGCRVSHDHIFGERMGSVRTGGVADTQVENASRD